MAIHPEGIVLKCKQLYSQTETLTQTFQSVAPFWTQNKINGTVLRPSKIPYNTRWKRVLIYCECQTQLSFWDREYFSSLKTMRKCFNNVSWSFTVTIIIIIDRFIWNKKWSFRKALRDCNRTWGLGADVHYKAIYGIMRKAFFPILLIVGTT